MKNYYLLFLSVMLVTFSSCSSDSNEDELVAEDFTAANEAAIAAYLEANDLTSQRTSSGLHYIINNPGTGAQPTATSKVTVAYRGYFLDGTVFDQSEPEGATLGLNQVIEGWTEGIPLFREGGSGVLLIPSRLGYGSFDFRGIPGGSVLVFDITLISVN